MCLFLLAVVLGLDDEVFELVGDVGQVLFYVCKVDVAGLGVAGGAGWHSDEFARELFGECGGGHGAACACAECFAEVAFGYVGLAWHGGPPAFFFELLDGGFCHICGFLLEHLLKNVGEQGGEPLHGGGFGGGNAAQPVAACVGWLGGAAGGEAHGSR